MTINPKHIPVTVENTKQLLLSSFLEGLGPTFPYYEAMRRRISRRQSDLAWIPRADHRTLRVFDVNIWCPPQSRVPSWLKGLVLVWAGTVRHIVAAKDRRSVLLRCCGCTVYAHSIQYFMLVQLVVQSIRPFAHSFSTVVWSSTSTSSGTLATCSKRSTSVRK